MQELSYRALQQLNEVRTPFQPSKLL